MGLIQLKKGKKMIKKIILLLVLILNLVFVQNTVLAQGKYVKKLYVDSLQDKVETNWIKPEKINGKSAVVSFDLDKNGNISNVELLRSSKDKIFDKSAVDAIYKSLSFGPLPDDKDSLSVQYFFSPIFTSPTLVNKQNPLSRNQNGYFINIANRTSYVDMESYANNLQEKINSNWNPKSRKSKTTIVSLEIGKSGSIDNLTLSKSSQDKSFDRNVFDTILNSVPFEALPAGLESDSKKIQLVFNYNSSNKLGEPEHYITANSNNIKGYDKYIKQVECIISSSFEGKKYASNQDLLLEMNIDKTGKLVYVQLQKPSQNKNFDREILSIVQKTSFPPIPDEMNLNNFIQKYEVFTQKGHLIPHFISD